MPNTDEADALARELAQHDPRQPNLATTLATELGAVVAIRGPTTILTDGDHTWRSEGHPALGTAGSGDVLAGLVVGLAARDLDPLTAAAWGIAIHRQAGSHLGGPQPRAAYLAGDLLPVIATAIDQIAARIDASRRSARLA